MAFNPALVQFPVESLQHMFDRHKAVWGFAGVNWNNNTKALFQQALVNFMAITPTVIVGTYRGPGNDVWLVVELAPPNKCLIVRRPGYDVWSGWTLSAAQLAAVLNAPHNLQTPALVVFGQILEDILVAKDPESLDELAKQFLITYQAHGSERYEESSEKSLMEFFSAADNYVPPHLAKRISDNPALICDLNEVKRIAQHTLATLERHF